VGRTDRDLVAERTEDTMSQPNRERRAQRSDEAAQRRTPEQETATGVSTRSVRVRAERYLVAPVPGHQPPSTVEPTEAQRAIDALADDPEIRVVRVIQPATRGGGQSTPVAVVEMAPERAALLAASPQFYVEADHPLRYGTAALPHTDPGVTPFLDGMELTVQVDNSDGEPLAGAAVHVLAEQHPARAVTGADGRATVTVAAHEVDSIAGIYVRPEHDHWSAWLARPRLTTAEPNRVVCTRIDPAITEDWSRRAMGFDRLPPTFRGHGIKIAIVDSGVATAHDDLADRVLGGRDVVAQDEKSWQEDLVGFGTLAAGLIAASQDRSSVAGLAPETELHVCKIFPGGRFGDLVEALDYCIAQGVDIIDLGVGSPYPSLLVAQKIEEARRAGIACIAAAGSNAGPVAFPASLPTVLAVAAIGRLGTFPPDSYHATQLSGTPTPEGYFAARFSAYGPEIDVCAPGVGVVSTLPPNNLGALDGTAVAAPHVAALAALVLAHHPDFRNGYRIRGAARVERLFEILRTSCRPLPFNDRLRVGAGLPDAVVAVGLAPVQAYPAHPVLGTLWAAMTHAGLMPANVTLPSFSGGAAGTTTPAAMTAQQQPYDLGPAGFGAPIPGGATRGLTELRAAMHSAGLAPETIPSEE
jgi:subtilisin